MSLTIHPNSSGPVDAAILIKSITRGKNYVKKNERYFFHKRRMDIEIHPHKPMPLTPMPLPQPQAPRRYRMQDAPGVPISPESSPRFRQRLPDYPPDTA